MEQDAETEEATVWLHTIRPDVKRNVLKSIFLSSQIFQAGWWPKLREAEYHTCKRTLIRVYKLACKDAYSGVQDPEQGGDGWLSDAEVVAMSEQYHPAVLLRLLRLMTSEYNIYPKMMPIISLPLSKRVIL